MQDRLHDLRQYLGARSQNLVDLLPNKVSAVYEARRNDRTDMGIFEAQLGKSHESKDSPFMGGYLTQINSIKQGINGIAATCDHVKQLKQKMLATATPADEQKFSEELQRILHESSKSIMNLKNSLESLKEANNFFRTKNPNTSEAKIRDNMHSALTRKFQVLLTEYQTLQTDYKKSVKDKIERQIRIVCPEASEREVQEIVDGAGSSVTQQKIYAKMTGAHENLQYAYQDIQHKHRDVKRLEQSVAELHQMFVDLATLVAQQGEILDQVEYSVQTAADYTEKADRDMVVAQKNLSKRKKWAFCISICLVVLAVIIMIPLLILLKR